MTRVIALEGLPFSGKSTSIAVASDHNSSIVTVPEYHDLDHLVGGLDYNELPLSSEMQLEHAYRYQEIEEHRWRYVHEAPANSLVMLDRCHISIIAYALAIDREKSLKTVQAVVSRYEERINTAEFLVGEPDVVVFLEMSGPIAVERIRRLHTSMSDELVSPSFISHLVDAYEELMSTCKSQVVRISSDGMLSETTEAVWEFVDDLT